MELRYLDCCLPDYFQGSSNPVIAVPVTNQTTFRELKQAIIDSYNNGDDDLPEVDIYKLSGELFLSVASLDLVAFPYIEANKISDFSDCDVYAYFTLIQ